MWVAHGFVMKYAFAHDRANEKAYVTVNDKACWNKTLTNNPQGSQQCGDTTLSGDIWFEESLAVQCAAESVDGKLTVRVYADLNQVGTDESFAIDNVIVLKMSTGTSHCLFSVEEVSFSVENV